MIEQDKYPEAIWNPILTAFFSAIQLKLACKQCVQIQHASGQLYQAPTSFLHVSLSFRMKPASEDENIIRQPLVFAITHLKDKNSSKQTLKTSNPPFHSRVGVTSTLSNITFDFHAWLHPGSTRKPIFLAYLHSSFNTLTWVAWKTLW